MIDRDNEAVDWAALEPLARGKRKREYKLADYATPYEKLKSLPEVERNLKPGLSLAQLERIAGLMSDTESARQLGVAKARLLRACKTE